MSNLIQTSRTELGLTSGELARRLGVSIGAVSQLERSEREGSIKLASLERALSALGRRPLLSASELSPTSAFTAERVTDAMNAALDDGDETFALRVLTRAVQNVRRDPDSIGHVPETRSSQVKDLKWETLFRALYGDALPEERRPGWADARPLKRRWYVSQFEPLRERAKSTTPPRLRRLNIYLDSRSLERA